MGRSQRQKGARGERIWRDRLQAVWPEAKRGIGQTRSASEVADVDGPGVWMWCECKVGKQPNIRAAVRQAQEATDGRPVVALVQDDGAGARPPGLWSCMVFEDWLAMVGEIESLRATVRELKQETDDGRDTGETRDSLHTPEQDSSLGSQPEDAR